MNLRTGEELDRAAHDAVVREMALRHCKWDAQVGDVCTLAPYPLLVDAAEWATLAARAEAMAAELHAVGDELHARPDLHAMLGVPRALRRVFATPGMRPTPAAARILRFDFHPTTDGWRLSEVNADVPGGYTEATSLTGLAAARSPGAAPAGDPTARVVDRLARHGDVAFVVAPGHLEDQQVVQYLAGRVRACGARTRVVPAHHLQAWRGGAVFRFFQAEWLARLSAVEAWGPLFVGGRAAVANPAAHVLLESKRLPLVLDRLVARAPVFRAALPETRAPGDAPWLRDDGWLVKSAYSNTGDTVSIRSAMTRTAWARRAAEVLLAPGRWIAQRRFQVVPTPAPDGTPLHVCVGVYTVDGVAAGAYARATRGSHIDGAALDVPLLIAAG